MSTDEMIDFINETFKIKDGEINWYHKKLGYWDYSKDTKKNEDGISIDNCSLITAYNIYKLNTKHNQGHIDFNITATDKELFELGEHLINQADKEHQLNFDDIYEINRKMAIVGCKNFITNQHIRWIIEDSIECNDSMGLSCGFYQVLGRILKKRHDEIPQILKIEGETVINSINNFIDKLNEITQTNNEEYIVQNGRIYKYIGDV